MKRKPALIAGGLLLSLTIVIATGFWLLRHQPAFYRQALVGELSPGERKAQARRFTQSALELANGIRNDESWSQDFSEAAINSWLGLELPLRYAEWLPNEIQSPRVKLEDDGLWIAFQTRRGAWSGVVSGHLRTWVAGPNEVAIEIRSLSLGLVPIPIDEALREIVTAMNSAGWQLEWRQSAGHDVLVVTLDEETLGGDESQNPMLEEIDLRSGRLRIRGRRLARGTTARRQAATALSHETRGGSTGVK